MGNSTYSNGIEARSIAHPLVGWLLQEIGDMVNHNIWVILCCLRRVRSEVHWGPDSRCLMMHFRLRLLSQEHKALFCNPHPPCSLLPYQFCTVEGCRPSPATLNYSALLNLSMHVHASVCAFAEMTLPSYRVSHFLYVLWPKLASCCDYNLLPADHAASGHLFTGSFIPATCTQPRRIEIEEEKDTMNAPWPVLVSFCPLDAPLGLHLQKSLSYFKI